MIMQYGSVIKLVEMTISHKTQLGRYFVSMIRIIRWGYDPGSNTLHFTFRTVLRFDIIKECSFTLLEKKTSPLTQSSVVNLRLVIRSRYMGQLIPIEAVG